jgi:hypothetical protein
MPDKLPPDNRERPPHEHEWAWFWDNADKAQKSWIIVGPIHAAVTNWKAWLIMGGVVAWMRGPELIEIVKVMAQ